MAEAPIAAMKAVAERLDGLGLDYAFLGGSVVSLLLDHPELSPVRATDDVDVVIEVVSQARYAGIEQKLRVLKFDHDMRQGAPRCRWVLGNLTVDIMPADGDFLGLNTAWFREALASATPRPVPGGTLRVVSPVGFIATKYVAFLDRGAGDYYASHDLEDLITVIDGREKIVEEVAVADPALRAYVTKAMVALVVSEDFMEALPGHLSADAASQGRLSGLRRKLTGIAALG
jgi:predicted nucleotidyltransferase